MEQEGLWVDDAKLSPVVFGPCKRSENSAILRCNRLAWTSARAIAADSGAKLLERIQVDPFSGSR